MSLAEGYAPAQPLPMSSATARHGSRTERIWISEGGECGGEKGEGKYVLALTNARGAGVRKKRKLIRVKWQLLNERGKRKAVLNEVRRHHGIWRTAGYYEGNQIKEGWT